MDGSGNSFKLEGESNTDYLGWDATVAEPLIIGNNNNVATNDVTKVSINYGRAVNPIGVPVAMLNLGSKTFQGEGRRWMDVGTFGSIGSDDCYFGLKSEGPERTDAVIAWGDDYDNFFALLPNQISEIHLCLQESKKYYI